MKLLKIWYQLGIVALSLAGLQGCDSKENITISGTINNPGNIKVVSFFEGERKLDSVFIADGNRFRFERGSTQPRLLTVVVGKNRYPIILEPGQPVKFDTDLQQPEQYQLSGSELSEILKSFAPAKNRIEFVQDSLQKVFTAATVDKSSEQIQNLRSEMLQRFEPHMKRYIQQAVAFANEQPNLAGFYAMSTLEPEIAEVELIAYGDQIKDQFTDNRYVTEFKAEVDKLRALAIGQPAPYFEAYTTQNKLVKLTDFKGKYTLVDFWASWCLPCREENPNIVKQYAAFKDHGFEVLGVSLDDNPGSWMRAMKDDGLTWTNISDLKAWSSPLIIDYRIRAIPTSYLLDPSGNIIAKNLRGKALEDFLKKTLN
ncbi:MULTISPECIES: TlpA family protein disulfide reductase [Sphingobacterium]|uniref:TlpA family protein disulfide reductase n=1 Tax=Sphingobacterium populi TaxID=1812824 RepID=A0ABW5U898_9SPHI|nr:TlpA disulfide reductase family protein [Sphingobacterium sp. CFCC 11742]